MILTFPAQECGPSASYQSHLLETDACTTGGGDDNGVWEAGEQVEFRLTVQNDGSKDLTARALEHARRLLADYEEPRLDAGVDEALRDYIARREREIPAADALNTEY